MAENETAEDMPTQKYEMTITLELPADTVAVILDPVQTLRGSTVRRVNAHDISDQIPCSLTPLVLVTGKNAPGIGELVPRGEVGEV